MLKLRAPIELVCRRSLSRLKEGFSERIRANYLQMTGSVDETDLLHLVTRPPDIFMMEGGAGSIMNRTSITNSAVQKVEIINNLINRILVSADASLSYQDRVFITNTLHSLGIRDDRRFMQEIYRLTRQTKDTNELINLYWENITDLKSLVQDVKENSRTDITNEISEDKRQILHLHETVNERLQTGAIYKIVQNFAQSIYSDSYITREEFMVSEQTRLSRELLLNRLRSEVRGEDTPLVYRHENVYESPDVTNEEVSIRQINERISSAVLLNLIDNIYQSSYERTDHRQDNWFRTESAYYESADNTLFRIENNSALIQYLHEENESRSDTRSEERYEIDLLNEVLDRRRWGSFSTYLSPQGNTYENLEQSERIYREGDTDITVNEGSTSELIHVRRDGDTREEIRQEGDVNNLSERVYQTYQQSMARNEKYMSNLRRIVEQHTDERQTTTLREVQRLTLTALQHPEEFVRDMREAAEKSDEREQELKQAIAAALPPEIREIRELVEEFIGSPMTYHQREMLTNRNLERLYLDIIRAEHPETAGIAYGPEAEEGIAALRAEAESALSYTAAPETQRMGDEGVLVHRQEAEPAEASFEAGDQAPAAETSYADRIAENERLITELRERSERITTALSSWNELTQSEKSSVVREFVSSQLTISEESSLYDSRILDRELRRTTERIRELTDVTQRLRSHTQRLEESSETEARTLRSETERLELIHDSRDIDRISESTERVISSREREQLRDEIKRESLLERTEAGIRNRAEIERLTSHEVESLNLVHEMRTEAESSYVSRIREHSEKQAILDEITRQVTERIRERSGVLLSERVDEIQESNLAFVHKSIENVVDEQALESIREELDRVRQVNRNTQETTVSNELSFTKHINNIDTQVTEENDEQIQKLVNRTLRRQIDSITEKVYSRIERQLQNERRRRGL